MNAFGDTLRKLMSERGITALKLSEGMGIPLRSIQEWTQNGRFPRDADVIRSVASYFGCSVYYLLYGAEDPHGSIVHKMIEKATLHTGTYEITIRQVKVDDGSHG